MQLLIKASRAETKDSFSIIFKKPKAFSFYAGQFLDIKLNNQVRSFSISSSPTERKLMITIKKGISKFKKILENIKAGDFLLSTHPAGTFTLNENQPTLFLAGGIGITPFRSMIKYTIDQKLQIPITLIYSNSDQNFIFKKELDSWQKEYPKLQIKYINTGSDGHLDKHMLIKLYPVPYTLNPIFYLAGSPKMVIDFKKMLIGLNIDEVNIRTDEFTGY